jgi:hypothetical protein
VNILLQEDLGASAAAIEKISELLGSVGDDIAGIRVYATPGGWWANMVASRLSSIPILSVTCEVQKSILSTGEKAMLRSYSTIYRSLLAPADAVPAVRQAVVAPRQPLEPVISDIVLRVEQKPPAISGGSEACKRVCASSEP